MMKSRNLLLGALCFAAGWVGAAEVYKWVDANGQTQYSDQPPPGTVKRDLVRIHKSGGMMPVQRAGGDSMESGASERRPKGTEAEAPPLPAEKSDPAAERAAAQEACKQATDKLQGIEDAASHSATDAKGNQRELSVSEVNQLLAAARKEKAQACGRGR
ncbi:DUF4124 domain-containing protein [Chitinimonas sp. BJYL2]|uniref:DUF4124 domain-containing protein n=1 Tax=Chitinimonas sp. BJYL2 TaxID=2976696 RepID=UPI0022B3C571|nr:DUF4124 domain-containing protein [Chitinimonas sp. BJYL2]